MSHAQPKRLLIEIGNSHSVVGLAEGKSVVRTWRVETRLRTVDEWRWILQASLEEAGIQASALQALLVASVVREAHVAPLQALPNVPSTQLTWKAPWSFQINVERPEGLGIDRLLNLQAARTQSPGPLIVVDLGTATTLSVLNQQNAFIGGVIAPGVKMFAHALATQTSMLYEVPVELPSRVIGNHTTAALQSGIAWGTLSLVRGLLKHAKEELEAPDAKVFLTGGWAQVFHQELAEAVHIPHLTLQGMLEAYESMD